jgi:hypothetical protein
VVAEMGNRYGDVTAHATRLDQFGRCESSSATCRVSCKLEAATIAVPWWNQGHSLCWRGIRLQPPHHEGP